MELSGHTGLEAPKVRMVSEKTIPFLWNTVNGMGLNTPVERSLSKNVMTFLVAIKSSDESPDGALENPVTHGHIGLHVESHVKDYLPKPALAGIIEKPNPKTIPNKNVKKVASLEK